MSVSAHPLLPVVQKLGRHGHLSDDDRDAFLALPFAVHELDRECYAVRTGQVPLHFSVLLSGYSYGQKLERGGGRQIVSLQLPGDLLNPHNIFIDASDHNVQMLTNCEVAFIPQHAIANLLERRPAVAKAIVVDILTKGSKQREWMINIGRRNARERVAHILCEYASVSGIGGINGKGVYEMPMTQEQIADSLGLTKVHVNRTLKVLENEGLASPERRSVTFSDVAALREICGFSSLYLHESSRPA